MPIVTLNKGTKTLKVELTDAEFAVVDRLVTVKGSPVIEAAIAYLVQQHGQLQADQEKAALTDYVKTVNPTKRAALAAIMNADL